MNKLTYKNIVITDSLIHENEKQQYDSFNVIRIMDNKNVWRIVKSNFSNKIVTTDRVILRDSGKIISNTEKVADNLTKFYMNTGNTLKINKDKRSLVETNDLFHPVLKEIKKYSTHGSIPNIKEKMNDNVFSFRNATYEEIPNESNNLDTSKST